MDIQLLRTSMNSQGTLGVLLASFFSCRTIELPWKENRNSISCIPEGTYDLVPYYSRKYGWVFQVKDVTGRTYILTHAGNYAGDTSKGWRTHSRGCILVGKRNGRLGKQQAVLTSKFTLSKLVRVLGKRKSHTLTIRRVF